MASKAGTQKPVTLRYKLALSAKRLNKDLQKARNQFKSTVKRIRKTFYSLNIAKYLFAGLDSYLDEFKTKARTVFNFKELGFKSEIAEQVFKISDNFEKLGYNAESANDSILRFITTGRSTALNDIGIYLDKLTASTLSNADANTRLNYILQNGQGKYKELEKAMSPHIRLLTQTRKQVDDLKKSLGASFLGVIANIINAFGGFNSVLKGAIISFAVYKSLMIAGNIAIGVSNTIAKFGLLSFSWAVPLGIALIGGLTALGAVGAIGTVAGIAVNSLGSTPGNIKNEKNPHAPEIKVSVYQDKYGSLINQSSGGKKTSTQTTYGSGTDED